MSRPRDVDAAYRLLDHTAPGPGSDPRLVPGVGVDGQPPLRASGDHETAIVWVRCGACRQRLGRIVLLNSHARTGRPVQMFAELAVTVDADARPVRQRLARHLLDSETGEHPVDCPAHGRFLLADGSALGTARTTITKISNGRDRMGSLFVR